AAPRGRRLELCMITPFHEWSGRLGRWLDPDQVVDDTHAGEPVGLRSPDPWVIPLPASPHTGR
ncbi:MAG TPA: hypothetical protein VIQ02_20275, partial [Jiangellaceae bacterium]